MANIKGAVVVNKERCKPTEVNDKGYHYAFMQNPAACIGCASCGLVCPDGCITVYKVKL